jgi:hypothetical protein
MKLTMEIQGHYTGFSPHKQRQDEQVAYTAIWGNDSNGRYARAVIYGTVALAFNKTLNGMLSENEVISSKRIVVTLNGEWQTRTVVKDGKEEKQRSFVAKESEHAKAFNILDGIALEAARLRNDATQALSKAEKLREKGQLALAYESVAQFVANYAGVPLDLETFLADSEADDKEFGSTAHVDADPEALAAAHFAREDRVREAPEVVAASQHTAEGTDETVDESSEETVGFGSPEAEEQTADFGVDNEVLGPTDGAVDAAENVAEEDAIMIDAAPVDDVLDDTPAEPVRQPEAPQQKGPAFNAATPFANRPSIPPQAGSKPFSRPEPVRQVPQPVARPVPSQEELTPPPQAPVPSFLAPRTPRF